MQGLDNSTVPAQGQQENLLRRILKVLEQSTIAKKPHPPDDWNGFWDVYDQEAEEFDKSLVEKYLSDLGNNLVFAGLFSAVSATFLGVMLPNLSPDPSDTTNALLMMIYHELNNTAFLGQVPSLPSWDGPPWIIIWTQTLLYASLSTSLLAALGAVLGQQWLRDYRDNTREPRESRRIKRQLKVDGLETWHFEAVLRAIPGLLQLSLLLFGTGLGAYLWNRQRTVAAVVVGTSAFGTLFYIVASISSYLYASCPFTTPAFAFVYNSLRAIQSFTIIYVALPFSSLIEAIAIQFGNRRYTRYLVVGPLVILMRLMRSIVHNLLWILKRALHFLRPRRHQPVVDVSRSVLWLCRTSLDHDAVYTAAKRIPDVAFPTHGLRSWAAWGKIFRLVQFELKHPSPSPAVFVYAKALTSLYFTASTSKNRFSPFFSHVGIKDVATLRVDLYHSHDAMSLWFVLTVLQKWFDVVSNPDKLRIHQGKDIINALGPDMDLDDVPNDTLEWFLHPLLHGLSGAPLPWNKEENHRRHLFLQPLAIYILRRLLPIDKPSLLPSSKTIATCLRVMIAILDWQSIDLTDIKITDESDNIAKIFSHVLNLLLRPDITDAIQANPIHVQHPEATRIPQFISSKSPKSRTFSAYEVSHFRAILEPLARLASETKFKQHFWNKGMEKWTTDVFQATAGRNIEDASTPALCLHVCCSIDNLFKFEVIYSERIWDSYQANAGTSVLLEYLDPAYYQSRHPERNLRAASEPPPRRWLDPGFKNTIASAYALLMLSTHNDIFTSGTTPTVVRSIISAMQPEEYPLYRHVGLKVAHVVIRENLANITDDVRDQLLPALRSATFQNIQSDTITADDTSPDRFLYPKRDLHYLEVLFALANSECWLSQLRQDSCGHMQRCISIAKAIHTPSDDEDYRELSLRLVLIFARIACAENYVWPEWDIWFETRPDNQALLVEQAWEPQMLSECPDVIPLLIAFTNRMLSSLRGVSEEGLAMLPKDIVIAALDGISKQVQMMVDAGMDVDEMQNASEVLGREVANAHMNADEMQNASEVLGTEVVDVRMNADKMQKALEVLLKEVVKSRAELLRRFGA